MICRYGDVSLQGSQTKFEMKFNTHYDYTIPPGELFPSPSVTVPDQSMTIQEIIARYTRTGSLPVASFPQDSGGNEAFDTGFEPLDYQPDEIVQALKPKKAPEAEKTPTASEVPSVNEAEKAE